MKHIYIKLVSSTVLLASMACPLMAQETIGSAMPDTNSADSLVQIAFRKVAQDELLGGVSVIDFKELQKKNYNTYTLDNLQGYVGGWNGNSLWGMDGDNAGYLVLVDGVPRDMDNVLPSEIDKITFLKGASAVVLYGSRAAKGVIYVTTKRGKISDKLQIDVRANTGFYVPKSYPKYLGSAEYMTLYNEARANDGLSPLYSDTEIYYSATGVNPYRYPNTDYYSGDYLKKTYNRSDISAEFSGGNHRARYYANIGYKATKKTFYYGFKVHAIVSDDGYLLDYAITKASVNDARETIELLVNAQPKNRYLLGDEGYVGKDLHHQLKKMGYILWTPYRKNMKNAKKHNNHYLMALRRTMESDFSLLTYYNAENNRARSLTGFQERLEVAILAYNMAYCLERFN